MSGSNFTDEIKQSMSPNSKAMNKGPGKPSPNPVGGAKKASGAVPNKPAPPHQFKPPQPQAQGQAGLQQAADQFQAHTAPGPSMPQQSGLQHAHAQIVSALAQRDMLKGH